MTSASSQAGALAKPGDAIGILGGGQLGRMLALAAADLGLDVHIFAPDKDCPASRVARKTWFAAYDDMAALNEFAASVKVATIEFENIPTDAVDAIVAAGTPVRPDARCLAISQDRLAEKTYFHDIGIEPAAFARVDKVDQIQTALDSVGGNGVLKTRFSGYDGKGQVRLQGQVVASAAWASVEAQRSIIEAWIDHERELSVILVRTLDGAVRFWDPPENIHGKGVLRRSIFPSTAHAEILDHAKAMAKTLADSLDYVGVLALELFLTRDGKLIANEFAPRVHNSGHWTPDACITGQFEQHIRAVCGWPLGDPTRHSDGEMINLLGADVNDWEQFLAEGARVHLYGKRRTADGRKMGHVVKLKPRS